MAKNPRILSKLFSNGASTVMAVDGSSTAVSFTLEPPSNVAYVVDALILTFHSTSMDLSSATELRVLGAAGALTNGIRLFETKGIPSVEVDMFPTPVKRLVDFYRYSSWSGSGVQVSGHTDSIAAGTDHVSVTITWSSPIRLWSNNGDKLTVEVSDNLTGLAVMEAHAIGTQSLTKLSISSI